MAGSNHSNRVERVLERLDGWNEMENVRTYLFATLRNLHIEIRRRNCRAGASVTLDKAGGALAVAAPQPAHVEFRNLVRVLDDLPAGLRDTALAVGVDGMSYEEVAKLAAVPVGNVMSRPYCGRSTLRRVFERPARGNSAQAG